MPMVTRPRAHGAFASGAGAAATVGRGAGRSAVGAVDFADLLAPSEFGATLIGIARAQQRRGNRQPALCAQNEAAQTVGHDRAPAQDTPRDAPGSSR